MKRELCVQCIITMKIIRKELFRSALPHVCAIFVFVVVAVVYCRPAFDNKVLDQEDVLQWQGMARNSFEYKETHGHFPLWSNGMFSGMPAFQIALDPESVSIPGLFYGLLTFYLKKPANFFFLACLCFYFLTIALRVKPYIGIVGGLAYAYSTYNAVIVAVGHDTKMQSIALIPGVIGALILICEKKYWTGIVLATLFTGLMVSFNHIQIIYYTMIIAFGLLLGYGIPWLRRRQGRRFARTLALTLGAVIIGILSNAVSLFTTYDSSRESIRGGSELADAKSNYTKDGLSETAAFDFSLYKLEPFVMLVPDIYGGSTDLQLPADRSKAVRVLDKMPSDVAELVGESGPRYYWGGVGELFSGPPYAGAIIILLALCGFFVLRKSEPAKHNPKWWILAVCALTIVMSWGGYFESFNSFLLKYLPLYNKFRAPSMILVVPTFLFCMMAVLTLQTIVSAKDRVALWRRFRWGLLTVAGVFLVLGVLYFRFSYSSAWDADLLARATGKGRTAVGYITVFLRALHEDRQELFGRSLVRSLILISAAALTIGFAIRKRMRPAFMLAIVGVLAFADVLSMDLNYLNTDNYKATAEYQQNFAASNADKEIMADKGYYRVFDLRDSMSNALTYGAMTAYFHNSIGGYHAARLKIYEDLINRQLFNFPNCAPVINMLNTRYIIRPSTGGRDSVVRNNGSLGPVWFVQGVRYERSAQGVMSALSKFHPADTAILFAKDSGKVRLDAQTDPTGYIRLVKNDNDEISYVSQSRRKQFAVFSEVFYDRGWEAWVDGKQVPILRTNYVLRGLSLPAGRHIIRFFFRPLSYYLGRQIQWMASIITLLMMVGMAIAAWQESPFYRQRRARIGLTDVSSPEKCEPLSSALAAQPLASGEK